MVIHPQYAWEAPVMEGWVLLGGAGEYSLEEGG